MVPLHHRAKLDGVSEAGAWRRDATATLAGSTGMMGEVAGFPLARIATPPVAALKSDAARPR
jgi:hypothetical protein